MEKTRERATPASDFKRSLRLSWFFEQKYLLAVDATDPLTQPESSGVSQFQGITFLNIDSRRIAEKGCS